MKYGYKRNVPLPFGEAVEKVRNELSEESFSFHLLHRFTEGKRYFSFVSVLHIYDVMSFFLDSNSSLSISPFA